MAECVTHTCCLSYTLTLHLSLSLTPYAGFAASVIACEAKTIESERERGDSFSACLHAAVSRGVARQEKRGGRHRSRRREGGSEVGEVQESSSAS